MNKILRRDEYIKEVYDPMMEQKKYEDLKEVNEGLLKTLFGMVKNMFKEDWSTIKGDQSIIDAYKQLDDSLSGFSLMKLSKKGECNQIRQALVDFATDWYELKMSNAKESESDPKPAKSMKFKNDTLKSNLDNCQKKIKEVAKDDSQMLQWANFLLEDMKNIINKAIFKEIKNEETRKKLEKQIEDAKKVKEEENKLMEKWQNEQLKKIQKERETFITKAGADPKAIKEDLLGGKAIQNICGEFDKIRNAEDADRMKLFQADKMLGLSKLLTEEEFGNKESFKLTYQIMDHVYKLLNTYSNIEEFKEVPGPSVQAMCIAINAFIKNCVYGGTDYGDFLPLMAKCAVISNGVVSYNLPLNDAATKDINSKDGGNWFTDTAQMIAGQGFKKDSKNEKIVYPKEFRTNAKNIFDKIIVEANKLKEKSIKDYNSSLEKLKLKKEKSEVEVK